MRPQPHLGASGRAPRRLRAALALALLANVAAADGGARALRAVPAPSPSSGWCGAAPTQTFGTVPEAAGSCLGDVAIAAGSATPTCNASDAMFAIPSLHFHQARPARARQCQNAAARRFYSRVAAAQVTGCSGVGGTALVYVEMQLTATSPGARYDVGVYLRLDSPAAYSSGVSAANVGLRGRCVQATLPPTLGDGDGDACGDLNGTLTCVVRRPLSLACVDLVGQGTVTVPVCVTWASTAASNCATSGLLPSPATKCACSVVALQGLPVAGGPSRGVLYAPANSVFPEDSSAGGPAPPAPPSAGSAPPPAWVRLPRGGARSRGAGLTRAPFPRCRACSAAARRHTTGARRATAPAHAPVTCGTSGAASP